MYSARRTVSRRSRSPVDPFHGDLNGCSHCPSTTGNNPAPGFGRVSLICDAGGDAARCLSPLKDGPLTADQLADRLSVNAEKLSRLLYALVTAALLTVEGGEHHIMRTYTHGVIGYLLYAQRSREAKWRAVLGGILPDMFLALGFVPHYVEHVTSSPLVTALHDLLHHSTLHTVTVAMHSFVVVGPCLALSYVFYRPALPFFVGMLAHGIVDLLTHRQWAYNHLFPFPCASVQGIVSYTDRGFTVVEHALLLLFVMWWVRKRRRMHPGANLER